MYFHCMAHHLYFIQVEGLMFSADVLVIVCERTFYTIGESQPISVNTTDREKQTKQLCIQKVDVNSRRSKNRTPNWNSTQATKKKTTAERTSLCQAKKKPSTTEGKTAVIAVFCFCFFFCCFCIQFNSFLLERRGTKHSIYNAKETDEEKELQTLRESTANKQWIPNYSVVAGEIVNLEVCSRNSAYDFFRCNDRQ